MFRYLIYRTDIGNTIIRESAVSGTTGVNEAELFTDFTIPEIQPLYLYRVTGTTDVVVNIEANISTYLGEINPLNADSDVSFGLLTGYTATTDTTLTELRNDIDTVSGTANQNTSDISIVSGTVAQNTSDIATVSGTADQNTSDIAIVSAATDQNASNIQFLSGETDNRLEITDFNSYTGSTQPIIDGALTGASNGLTTSGRNVLLGGTLSQNTTINGGSFNVSLNNLNEFNVSFSGATFTDNGASGGLKYAADYSSNFVARSLVDKAYVDNVASGLDVKQSVRVATTTAETDINLSSFVGGVIDGVTLADGDRVLIKNQDSTAEQNGLYVYSISTSGFTRSEDADESPDGEVTSGLFTFVEEGTINGSSGYVLSTPNPITLDVTELNFSRFSAAGSFTAGVGLNLNNGEFSLDGAGISGDFLQWTGSVLNVTGITTSVDFNAYTASTQTALNDKLEISDFNIYTGSTQTILDSKVDNDIFTGYTASTQTTLDAKVDDDTFTGYTATTDSRLDTAESNISFISGVTDTKLDIATFSAYTGTSSVNEIQLVHTGETQVNNITPTALTWDVAQYSGTSYSYTGSSDIEILESGDYIISYNIVVNNGSNSNKSLGANIIVDNVTVIDETGSATSIVQGSGNASILGLASAKVTLTAGTKLELAVFRNGNSGDVNTIANSSTIRIAKDSTLQ